MRTYDRDTSTRTIERPPMRPDQRERPPVVRSSAHVTREAAETRVDLHPEVNVDLAFNPTSLRAPEPRKGFRQRWVADGTSDKADTTAQRNWFAKRRMGWEIRDPETVPPGLRHLYPSHKLSDGAVAIRIAGMVLCEMPERVGEQYGRAVQDKVNEQSRAVPQSLEELRRRERVGVGDLEIGDSRQSYRGRKAASYAE